MWQGSSFSELIENISIRSFGLQKCSKCFWCWNPSQPQSLEKISGPVGCWILSLDCHWAPPASPVWCSFGASLESQFPLWSINNHLTVMTRWTIEHKRTSPSPSPSPGGSWERSDISLVGVILRQKTPQLWEMISGLSDWWRDQPEKHLRLWRWLRVHWWRLSLWS